MYRTKQELLWGLLSGIDFLCIAECEGWGDTIVSRWEENISEYQKTLMERYGLDTRRADRETIIAYLGIVLDENAHDWYVRTSNQYAKKVGK